MDDASMIRRLKAELRQARDEVTFLRQRETTLVGEVTEAREQQTATAEVLRVIASSPTQLQDVLNTLAGTAARLCGAEHAVVQVPDGDVLRVVASVFATEEAARHWADRRAQRRAEGFPSLPITLVPERIAGRAALERRTIYVANLANTTEFPASREVFEAIGVQSQVTAPLIRGGELIGVFTLHALRTGAFSLSQVAQLETFANQAVIAIENARLFEELERRNVDLSEALEQQTATADILRVIASSPSNLQAVLDTIARSAMQLSGSSIAALLLRDGDHLVRRVSLIDHGEPHQAIGATIPLTARIDAVAAVLEHRTIHLPNRSAPSVLAEFPDSQIREAVATVTVPLMREHDAIGTLSVARDVALEYSAHEIALVEMFASQAVIAIENARLFEELEQRNRDLSEALEQQTATSEILRVIASSPAALQPVFDAIITSALRLSKSTWVELGIVDGDTVRITTGAVTRNHPDTPHIGRVTDLAAHSPAHVAIRDGRTMAILDRSDPAFSAEYPETTTGPYATLHVPLLSEGRGIGVISLGRDKNQPHRPEEIALVEMFANQAVIAIENARLFEELQDRTAALTQALEQQTVTAEVLRVIATSPTDLQGVLQEVAEGALRVCGAQAVSLSRLEGGKMRRAVLAGPSQTDGMRSDRLFAEGIPLTRDFVSGRAVLERRTIQIADLSTDPDYPIGQQVAVAGGHRTTLSVPLLRDDLALGALTVVRMTVLPFTDREVALLEAFADQAVIAIENARLFTELQERTGELARSVDELRALGEVGQAVSSSLDLQQVLTTIVSHATRLADAYGGTIYQLDEASQEFRLRAAYCVPDEVLAAVESSRPRLTDDSIVGRAARLGQAQQAPDLVTLLEDADTPVLDALRRAGFRALIAVPLVREQRTVGILVIRRKAPGNFSQPVVDLLQTLASQSVLAIENARLFQQVQEASQALEVASQHKSDFLANMSHELRTPLNAIIGYSEMLQEEAEDLDADAFLPDLQRINAAGKHLLGLINDILDLSKIEAGRMDLHLEQFDVGELVRDVASIVKPLIDKNGNTLIVTCPDDIGEMQADLTKVRQTLFNLLSNAAKFTDHGTISLSAARESGADGECIAFGVADTGIGMTEEQLGRLFAAFSQAEASTRSKYGGTGLGLAISRHFCRLMGGDLTVESVYGQGSTFTVRLPVEVLGPA